MLSTQIQQRNVAGITQRMNLTQAVSCLCVSHVHVSVWFHHAGSKCTDCKPLTKAFYEEQLKCLPVPNTLQVWVSSINPQIFFFVFSFFVLNDLVPGHNPIIDFTSFPWFFLDFFFFLQPYQSDSPLPLPQQYSVEQLMWENRAVNCCSGGRIWFKSRWQIPPKKDIFRAASDSRNMQRMRWARGVLHPRSVCHPGTWHFSAAIQDVCYCKWRVQAEVQPRYKQTKS